MSLVVYVWEGCWGDTCRSWRMISGILLCYSQLVFETKSVTKLGSRLVVNKFQRISFFDPPASVFACVWQFPGFFGLLMSALRWTCLNRKHFCPLSLLSLWPFSIKFQNRYCILSGENNFLFQNRFNQSFRIGD